MSSLKKKAIHGIAWSAIDNFSVQGIRFIVGIILARLLSPAEFGLIGMITIFLAISEYFIYSGFYEALIWKKDSTDIDYSTVFYFNLIVGFIFFFVLFFSAPLISTFFNEPQLKPIVRVISFILIIDAVTIIQRVTLAKRVDFKLQTKISLIATISSGIIAIVMAYAGYGVWSLVFQRISRQAINSFFLWLWNRWRPLWVFSKESFKELFSFGSKILASGLINTIYRNIYHLVIGKFFSVQELGYYTRAQMFNDLPSGNITRITTRVTFPVLVEMQDNPEQLKKGYKRILKSIMLITAILMIGLATTAEPMIITFIGEKWRPAISYLQLLSFIGIMYPLNSLNKNMLEVQGRSDLYLKLEIIQRVTAIPIIIAGIFLGIKVMILGMWLNELIAYFINSYWSGRMINYSVGEQIKDILPGFGIAMIMGAIIYLIGFFLPTTYWMTLLVQMAIGGLAALGLCEIFKPEAYLELRHIVTNTIKTYWNKG